MRVLIADDDDGVVAALHEALTADRRFEVLGVVTTGDEAVALARAANPDLVLLDVRMPGGGVGAARRLGALPAAPTVVVFSATASAGLVTELLGAGVAGVVEKGRAGADLTDLLARCHAGEIVLATSAAGAAIRLLLSRARST